MMRERLYLKGTGPAPRHRIEQQLADVEREIVRLKKAVRPKTIIRKKERIAGLKAIAEAYREALRT